MFVTGSNKTKNILHAHILETDIWKMNLQQQVRVRISGHSCLTKSRK